MGGQDNVGWRHCPGDLERGTGEEGCDEEQQARISWSTSTPKIAGDSVVFLAVTL